MIFLCAPKSLRAELIVFPEMVDTGYSMPAIQKHATSWNEGAVPKSTSSGEELSLAMRRRRFGPRLARAFTTRKCSSTCTAKSSANIARRIWSQRLRSTSVRAASRRRRVYELRDRQVQSRTTRFATTFDFRSLPSALRSNNRVNVFVNSSAWPYPRVEHLRILALARAIENQSYLILANRVGTDDGITFCGTSAIIDPLARSLAAASIDREELIQAEVSEDVIRNPFEAERPSSTIVDWT